MELRVGRVHHPATAPDLIDPRAEPTNDGHEEGRHDGAFGAARKFCTPLIQRAEDPVTHCKALYSKADRIRIKQIRFATELIRAPKPEGID